MPLGVEYPTMQACLSKAPRIHAIEAIEVPSKIRCGTSVATLHGRARRIGA